MRKLVELNTFKRKRTKRINFRIKPLDANLDRHHEKNPSNEDICCQLSQPIV